MREDGAYQDDMGRLSKLSDSALDRLLGGEVPEGDGDLAEIAAFMTDVRALADAGPAEETAARHLAAMAATVRVAANGGGVTAPLVTSVTPPDRGRPPRRTWRTPMTRKPFAPLPAKLAAAAAAAGLALVAFGGAAYAGVLPDPVEGPVVDLAGQAGISLPGNDSATPPAPAGTPIPLEELAAPADQPEANQVDQPEANQADQPDANQSDQPEANQADQPDANQSDQPNAGQVDQPSAGQADQPSAGQADQQNGGQADQGQQGGG